VCPTYGPDKDAGIEVRLSHLESEQNRTRERLHNAEGNIAALRILAEVGNEQRGELLTSVAELKADVRSGFTERDHEWDRAFRDQRESLNRTLRWAVTITATVASGIGALVVQLIHTAGG